MPPATSQPSAAPNPTGSTPAAPDPGATTVPPVSPPAAVPPVDNFDPTKLTTDQLNKVLENQDLWKNPRLAALLDADKQLKQLQKDKDAQTETQLTEQKKFEELAQKRADENKTLIGRLQTMTIDQALTNKLVKESVVDLDGALKLVDRSKISVDDNGQVAGIDEALTSLKTDKSYLFTAGTNPANPTVGNPTNTNSTVPNSGQFTFKESQITTEFYQANKDAVDKAMAMGMIEQDGPPRQ